MRQLNKKKEETDKEIKSLEKDIKLEEEAMKADNKGKSYTDLIKMKIS